MLIRWQDRDYDLDLSDFTLKQARVIEGESGMTLGKWLDALSGDGLNMGSPHFLPFLKIIYWLMLNQAGDDTPIGAVDFPLIKFGRAFMAAQEAEDAAQPPAREEAPDPTPPPQASAPSPALSSPSTTLAAAGSPDG